MYVTGHFFDKPGYSIRGRHSELDQILGELPILHSLTPTRKKKQRKERYSRMSAFKPKPA